MNSRIFTTHFRSFSGRRRRRTFEPLILQIEMRDEPRNNSAINTGVRGEILSNIASTIINSYQSGELQVKWEQANMTNGVVPNEMSVQEPFDYSTVELSVIDCYVRR